MRQTDRQTGVSRERERSGEKKRSERDRDREREGGRQTDWQAGRRTDRQAGRQTNRDRDTERQRERDYIISYRSTDQNTFILDLVLYTCSYHKPTHMTAVAEQAEIKFIGLCISQGLVYNEGPGCSPLGGGRPSERWSKNLLQTVFADGYNPSSICYEHHHKI